MLDPLSGGFPSEMLFAFTKFVVDASSISHRTVHLGEECAILTLLLLLLLL
jgi:hypothetical protein